MRTATLTALALFGGLVCGGPASAQSVGAPAGRDPATAPGGTEGIAGPRNETNAIRDGDAVAVPPGPGGVDAEAPRRGDGMPERPPSRY